jgi:hypothetical protein
MSCGSCWPSGEARRLRQEQRKRADHLVDVATKAMKQKAKYQKARQRAWTGKDDEQQEAYKAGETAYAHNPHFKDGTRLRKGPERESEFNEHEVLNGSELVVVDVRDGFAQVRMVAAGADGVVMEGWMRQRNLARTKDRPDLVGKDRMAGLGEGHMGHHPGMLQRPPLQAGSGKRPGTSL